MDDRNKTAHPNGHIFFRTQTALDTQVTEILRVVKEIQTHSKPVIMRCYREFLLRNHDDEEREYSDASDQIREVLIHKNYLSRKDVEICIGSDISDFSDEVGFAEIEALHYGLIADYGDGILETV